MSPNEVEITQRMPKSISAQGACSREEPQPKLSPATRILALIGRLVEDEIRILAAVVAIAFLREQPRAEPGTLDGLEILLGDDHVGIDVDHAQRRRDAIEGGKF